ncbi:MAG: (Fe-S)-binding protein [Rhodospirillales bacterium]|nr:(Fe-S)-binding protein [Rhodospirillales bacterium]MBO6787616.1 (Fe-S)-binding protein [Rhodospirillales bacterium]
MSDTAKPTVGLFATCLVDLMRPVVGFAAVKLLEDAGCRVDVPVAQTCCGQPAYNSGDKTDAQDIAKSVIETFEGFDYVVAPSGSCAGMIKDHYPEAFEDDTEWRPRAQALAAKTYELMSFLADVRGVTSTGAAFEGTVTYHDSCSGLRELGIKDQPRALLSTVSGLHISEGKETETCCGFGGLFCVKYPDISEKMVDAKVDDIVATGADTVLAGDLGCLMNIAGRLQRRGLSIKARHAAEVLAGMSAAPAIGEPADEE